LQASGLATRAWHSLPSTITQLQAWTTGERRDELLLHTGVVHSHPDQTQDVLFGIELGGDRGGTVRWRIDVSAPTGNGEMPALRESRRVTPATAGSVLATPTRAGVCLVGLLTGNLLTRPIIAPAGRERIMPRTPVAAVGGMFVVAVDPETLVGIPARSNATPWWRVSLPADRIVELTTVGDLVVAAGPGRQHLWVIDPLNGRVRRELDLGGSPRGDFSEAARRETCRVVLVGPYVVSADGERLTTRHLKTGQPMWQTPMPDRVKDVRALDADHLCVCDADRVYCVTLSDGRIVGSVPVQDAFLPPIDAALVDADRLMLVLETDENPPQTKIEWFSLAEGKRTVRQGPLEHETLTPLMVRASADVVPAVEGQYRPSDGGAERVRIFPGGRVEPSFSSETLLYSRVYLYTKKTGRPMGRYIEIGPGGEDGPTEAQPVVDVTIVDGQIVVVTTAGVQTIGLKANTDEGGSR